LLRCPWDIPACRATLRNGTPALSRNDLSVGPSYPVTAHPPGSPDPSPAPR
jgi:hypothetical protein